MMASWLWNPHPQLSFQQHEPHLFSTQSRRTHFSKSLQYRHPSSYRFHSSRSSNNKIYCYNSDDTTNKGPEKTTGIQVYRDIERLLTDSVRQSQDPWAGSRDWSEVEGAWVLKPRKTKPRSVVHFVGGIFVGAAPQLTYRLFLEGLAEKGVLVIATPYASGFDHFFIADEVQLKFDRCHRSLQETVQDLPTFGIGHSLGSVIHLLIGSRYAVQRNGNVLMAFNSKVHAVKAFLFWFPPPPPSFSNTLRLTKIANASPLQEASSAIPLFSPVLVPMAQSIGPLLSQITSSPTVRLGAEMTMKQLENLSPPIMKQVLPLVEQLPPLYMDLVNGRENFTPKPEETRRLESEISTPAIGLPAKGDLLTEPTPAIHPSLRPFPSPAIGFPEKGDPRLNPPFSHAVIHVGESAIINPCKLISPSIQTQPEGWERTATRLKGSTGNVFSVISEQIAHDVFMTNDAMDGTVFHIFLKNVLLCPDLRAKGLLGWPKDALVSRLEIGNNSQ
ncbi:hypothetical protein RHGRI_034059 [Rhododendron griersonianum]|uniref:Uncharacterized protein n=1 Tax=Rhododendron griersonianum TaxID=479676 RepID=A0AAV6HZ47_9ERIC|nr:hypothetical protein RHGRI_034059 [Rhododendron griersonianum]